MGFLLVVAGAVVTVLVQRWVRSTGGVNYDICWKNTRGAGSVDRPGGVEVQQRQLTVTFENRKDVPVTVRGIRVVFYKGDKPSDEEESPYMEFKRDRGEWGPFELVSLPSRIPVTRTISVAPGDNEPDRQRAVEEADRVEFEATIDGAKDIRIELALWNSLEPQTEHYRQAWWRRVFGG